MSEQKKWGGLEAELRLCNGNTPKCIFFDTPLVMNVHEQTELAREIERRFNHHNELVALLEEIKRELNGGMNTLDTAASAKPLEMKIDAILSAINRSAS